MTTPASLPTGIPAARERCPGARRALGLLLLINLFNYIDRNVLAAVVPWIRDDCFGAGGAVRGSPALTALLQWSQRHLGFTPENALIGILGTAFMVVYTIGAPAFGRLAERHSRWTLVGIGVVLWSLASGASGLAGTFMVLLLTRCFVGIGEAAYGPVAPSLISDYYPVKVRGRVLAWFYMAIPVGSALGYVLGERVAGSGLGRWGAGMFGCSPESWRWAFYLVVGPGIALGAWSFFMREPPRGQTDLGRAAAPVAVRWRDYALLLRTPSYVFCTLGMAAMTFAIGGIAFWMPCFLKGRPGTGDSPITDLRRHPCRGGARRHLPWGPGGRPAARAASRRLLSGVGRRDARRLPAVSGRASGAVPAGLAADLPRLLLPVLQHRPDQHDPRQRDASLDARRRIRAQHLRDSHARRRHLAGDHRRHQRQIQHRGRLPRRWLHVSRAGVLWLSGARHLQRDTELAPGRLPSFPAEGTTAFRP